LDFRIRPVRPDTDYPSVVEIINRAVQAEPITLEELREQLRNRHPAEIRYEIVAVNATDGDVLGTSWVFREPWMKPGRFHLGVAVDPVYRHHGIGTRLYREVENFAEDGGAFSLRAQVRDNDPISLAFARQRGFAVDRHIFESTLDLSTFDEHRFDGAVDRVSAAGIRFFTLADLCDTDSTRRALYELNRRTALDIPGKDDDFGPFEEFCKFVFEASWYRPDGQIIAVSGDAWAGMTALRFFPQTGCCYTNMTGVDCVYRGRGIALALKILSTKTARQYGATYMRTENDSKNLAMLAVNHKLGYEAQPGYYRLTKGPVAESND